MRRLIPNARNTTKFDATVQLQCAGRACWFIYFIVKKRAQYWAVRYLSISAASQQLFIEFHCWRNPCFRRSTYALNAKETDRNNSRLSSSSSRKPRQRHIDATIHANRCRQKRLTSHVRKPNEGQKPTSLTRVLELPSSGSHWGHRTGWHRNVGDSWPTSPSTTTVTWHI
jgi:hypothetical protein